MERRLARRSRLRRWALVAGAVLVVLLFPFFVLSLTRRLDASKDAIVIMFLGYTNPPTNPGRFALFSVSNQAPYSVRWRGDWTEVEGLADRKAPIVNPNLPGLRREPLLKPGRSLLLARGAPDESEGNRWRFGMSFSRYTWQAWWLDQSFRLNGKLPLRLGSIVIVDDQRILDPSNHVTVTSAWLTK